MLKKTLNVIIPLGIGVALLVLVYNRTPKETLGEIILNIQKAELKFILISLFLGIISHWVRAIRWNLLLSPMGYKPPIATNFYLIMAAYLTNLGIPRSGEFLRASGLTKYEKVPFEKGFGTIVTERIIDVLMLLLIILSALVFQTEQILNYLNQYGSGLVIGVSILLAGCLGLVLLIKLLAMTQNPVLKKLLAFLKGLNDGVLSIFSLKNKWLFWIHTLIIWVCYLAMFWVVKFALPGTHMLDFGSLLVAFVAGAFAMMIFPGGFGGYPIFVGSALTLFGLSTESANAFGWLIWISQTLLVVILGAISFLLLSFSPSKR